MCECDLSVSAEASCLFRIQTAPLPDTRTSTVQPCQHTCRVATVTYVIRQNLAVFRGGAVDVPALRYVIPKPFPEDIA